MAAGEPQQPDDDRTQRKRARLAAWSQVIGAVLVIVTLTCTLLNVISAQQAVALGLPAVLLIVGGLIAAAAIDSSSSERRAFRTGLRVGNLLRRLYAALRRLVGS
jgi:Na+/melibiose symporter-like transporter